MRRLTDAANMVQVDISAPKMRPRQPPPTPKRLVFFAWWFEEGVKKYMELRLETKLPPLDGPDKHLYQIYYPLIQDFVPENYKIGHQLY